MSSKKQILSDIKKNTKILQNYYFRAQRYAKSLIAEATSGRQVQDQAIRTKFKNQKSKAIQDKKERLGQVKSEYEKTMAIERRLFDNRIKTIEEEISDLISVRWSGLDFTDESWNNHKPIMDGNGKIPRLTRMGELTGKGENITINLPGLLPIIGEGHVFLKASGEMKDKAIETHAMFNAEALGNVACSQAQIHINRSKRIGKEYVMVPEFTGRFNWWQALD